jgi:hypothetical protein
VEFMDSETFYLINDAGKDIVYYFQARQSLKCPPIRPVRKTPNLKNTFFIN